jgi:hypothetical protein
VMNRKAFSLTFILVMMAFFIGLVAYAIPVVRVVKANPYTAPECRFLSPKNNTAYNTTSVNFSFVVYDDWVYYYSFDKRIEMKQVRVEEISQNLAESGETMFQFSTELNDLGDGKHNLTIYCKDAVEFFFPRPIQVLATITFYVDTLAPNISSLYVNCTEPSDLLLNFIVDEELSWVGYSLDNQTNVTINGNTTLKELPAGSHNVTVYAKDTAGNVGTSETIHFTVEESPEPFRTTFVIASVIIIVVVLAVFLFVRKHQH